MNYILLVILVLGIENLGYSAVTNVGIGGGGAMSGISFDPFNKGHLYIGTDMGLVYESFDEGINWTPISQQKINFNSDLTHPGHMGFDTKGNLYWASGGCNPLVSHDRGKNWSQMSELKRLLPKNCLGDNTRIKYWFFSNYDDKFIGIGSTSGLFISKDDGMTWSRFYTGQDSLDSLITDKNNLIYASSNGIYDFNLNTSTSKSKLAASLSLATMGQDEKGITIIGVKKSQNIEKTVYIKSPNQTNFSEQKLPIGEFVKMSPKNSSIIYFTGSPQNNTGDSVWFSDDSGSNWSQRYTNDADAYKNGIINPNPVGLFVGFWDNGYHDFQVSPYDPSVLAASGNFFFKLSSDNGIHWQFPYSEPINPAQTISKTDFWKSTQLNPVSVYLIKRNPGNPKMIVAGLADIGCILSMDDGASWRMCNIPNMNSIYDIEFNPTNPNQLFAAASSIHDFPLDWHGDIQNTAAGGVYVSDNAGVSWKKITPTGQEYQNPYLSVAIDFKQTPCQIYAGTQGKGIITSSDCGKTWIRMNNGFEPLESSQNSQDLKGSLIFPKIKISPVTSEVYALHTGNRLWRSDDLGNPYVRYTGIYKLDKKIKKWIQLGHTDKLPSEGELGPYWKYPIDFAVDWQNPKRMYLIDLSTQGSWKVGGVWFSADEGKLWVQKLKFNDPRKVLIQGDSVFVAGWNDNFEDSFIFKAKINNSEFVPMNINLPFRLVDDFLLDEKDIFFGTFGGGIYKASYTSSN